MARIAGVNVPENKHLEIAISKCLFSGTFTPAILAINYPCFCLCLGSVLQITYRTPFLLTNLQSLQIFLTDALTFIIIFYSF